MKWWPVLVAALIAMPLAACDRAASSAQQPPSTHNSAPTSGTTTPTTTPPAEDELPPDVYWTFLLIWVEQDDSYRASVCKDIGPGPSLLSPRQAALAIKLAWKRDYGHFEVFDEVDWHSDETWDAMTQLLARECR